ncbi:MAG: hypothetical protein DMG21_02945, partial [Acidobacteria bacterium]
MITKDPGGFLRCGKAKIFSVALIAFAGLILTLGRDASAAPPAVTTGTVASERVVAIADVHGDYDQFVAVLRRMGLVDASGKWAGG